MSNVIKASVFNRIFKELQQLDEIRNDKFSILILGGGHKTKRFYRELEKDHDVELLWRGWSGPRWSKVFSFIPGQAGLIKLKNVNRLLEIHDLVGEQSTCRLYYLPIGKSSLLIDSIRSNYWKSIDSQHAEDITSKLDNYFILETFYDLSQDNVGQDLYRIQVEYGDETNQKIKDVLVKFNADL